MSEENEVVEIEEVEAPEVEVEPIEADAVATPSAEHEEEDDGEMVITIGEQEPEPDQEASAPSWVKELRRNYREAQKELRELKEKQSQQAAPAAVTVGAKPTLEGCDFDTDKYDAELTAWYERKRKADEQAAQAEAEKQKAQQEWQKKLDGYAKSKTELRVKDYDEAEATVQEKLNQVQQGIILQGADNPALIVYALGKNEKRAAELAQITDPVKFAFEIGKLSKEINMKPRAKPPAPEKTVSGSGSLSGTVDSTLDRLRAEAEKTGDYTKVMAYKNQLRNK